MSRGGRPRAARGTLLLLMSDGRRAAKGKEEHHRSGPFHHLLFASSSPFVKPVLPSLIYRIHMESHGSHSINQSSRPAACMHASNFAPPPTSLYTLQPEPQSTTAQPSRPLGDPLAD